MHINITLRLGDREEDLRIPTTIEVGRLMEELAEIFGLPQKQEKRQLKVIPKGLILDEGKRLKDYPVSDGDILVWMQQGE